MTGRLPTTYLIGAPKSGTTSLASWLAGHPDVYFSVPKEPYYWAADYPKMRAHYGFDTRPRYESLFASAEADSASLLAEGSTNYLYSRAAVPDILTAVEDPRFIVALRKPVDLLVSYHRTQLVALNEDDADFAAAWRRSARGIDPRGVPLDPKLVDYPLVGRLGDAVERLLDLVPRESVHVVLFEDLAADPERIWTKLIGFLGLSADYRPAFDVRNASNKTYRSALLRRVTHRPPAVLDPPIRWLRQWSRTTSIPLAAKAKARMWRSERRPEVDSAIRAEVADFLAEDTMRLGEVLRIDLSHWATVRPRQDR